MRRSSLTGRLIALLTLGLSGLWLLAVAGTGLVMYHELNEAFDSVLQETAQRLLPLAVDDLRDGEAGDEDRAVADAISTMRDKEYLIYQVRDADGALLLRSHDAPHRPFPVSLRPGFRNAEGRRYFTETTADGNLFIQVAEPVTYRVEAVRDSLVGLLAPLLILVPVAGIAIWWTVSRMTRPIGEVRAAIGERGGANLALIADAGLPDELAPIVHDVNRLLERLAHALESERSFTANSAHELRTPVAAALAQTQRLAAELGDSPHRARIDNIAATLHRLGDLVEKLLQLSRVEAGVALSRETVDLLPVVRLLVDEVGRRQDLRGRLRFDDGGHAALSGHTDLDAFGIALRNVIDNAFVHGRADGPVEVAIDADGAVHVVNEGPVVPADTVDRLTHRFERGTATSRGSGLGLAIAETIMVQSGGGLDIHSPARGRPDGFEVVLRLGGAAAPVG